MFLKPMKNLFFTACSLLLLASCSEYQEALKSDDMGVKYNMADSLYNAGKYTKAIKLWDQVVPNYKGKPQAERVMFLYADTYYRAGDYYLSGYQFDRFATSYPQSEKIQEAKFKAAKSYYELSPSYDLDQDQTQKALDQLQIFLGQYPESEYTEQADSLIVELSTKVQKKSFEIAKQYNTIMKYPVALSALDDFISDYPGSPFREAAFFYKLDSQYKYAIGSFDVLVEDRLKEAIDIYDTLIRYYPDGAYREQADEIKADIDKRMQNYS
jgi:outer membrane protein assembly factor BamD